MRQLYVPIFLGLIVLSFILSFSLPVNPTTLAKYDISEVQARLLNLTILVPLTLIYLVALYGFLRVHDYAEKVRKTKEGPHFVKLSQGLMVLAFSLPISSVIGGVRSYVRFAHPHFLSDVVIARQYISIALVLCAMYLLAQGAEGLYGTLKRRNGLHLKTIYGVLVPVAFACIYTWVVVTRGMGSPTGEPYYLPSWLVVTTVVIPQLFAWCIGGWAAYNLYRYQANVKGVIYRRALDGIAKGIAAIIVIAALLQFLTPLSTALNRLDLGPLLILIYVILALYVVGYLLVASGAKKLKQIEEV